MSASRDEMLADSGVVGAMIAWADNNGIVRSRTVPIGELVRACEQGVGITPLFAVFDSHDAITFAHDGLSTPSGDIRLVPLPDRVTRLAGQPAFAWVPGKQVAADGSPWPYDQRTRLEEQLRRASEVGLEFQAGFEIEFFVARAVNDATEDLAPAHHGPAYGPLALLQIDEFCAQLLSDFDANGLPVGQLHAEYGQAQVEISLAPADPLTTADNQLLARQTIHAAARHHDLRASFAPLVSPDGVGNGWHLHTSVRREGRNLLTSDASGRPKTAGASYLAGLLRDLPAIAAVGAPSIPSLARRRPGYFAGAYRFWGVENREAPLRYVPSSSFLGDDHANVELKTVDASANPYLILAAVVAAGAAGIAEGLDLSEPIQEDPGTWDEPRREQSGVELLPTTPEAQEAALASNERIAQVLGPSLLNAFLAVRRSDATWAAERELNEIVAAHRWRY